MCRKAVSTIWYLRNAIFHESEEDIQGCNRAVYSIISRVREWRSARRN